MRTFFKHLSTILLDEHDMVDYIILGVALVLLIGAVIARHNF